MQLVLDLVRKDSHECYTPCSIYLLQGVIFVMQTDILLNDHRVGYAELNRKGLYYEIHCVCEPPENIPYKILVQCGKQKVDLGICVPYDNGFGLRTRVPVKRLGDGEMTFHLVKKKQDSVFVPIVQDHTFPHMDKLCDSRLVTENHQVGICITAEEDQRDNDRNP